MNTYRFSTVSMLCVVRNEPVSAVPLVLEMADATAQDWLMFCLYAALALDLLLALAIFPLPDGRLNV